VVTRRRLLLGAAAIAAAGGLVGWRLSTRDTRRRWTFPDAGITAPPFCTGGCVYVPSKDGGLYALGAATGEQRWKYERAGFEVFDVSAVADTVYLSMASRTYDPATRATAAVAVDARSGQERWHFTNGASGTWGLSVGSGQVYVGGVDRERVSNGLYALDAGTGTVRWQFTSTKQPVFGSPVEADGVVFFSAPSDGIYAVDAGNAEVRWHFPTGDQWASGPALGGPTLYAGTENGVLALDAGTGEQIWFINVAADRPAPVVSGSSVYFSDSAVSEPDHALYAVNAGTGEHKWTLGLGNWATTPAVAGDVVYVVDGNGLIAVDGNGKPRWTYAEDNTVFHTPVVADGSLYVCTDGHELLALRP
jgi:outer membrane protein assembly factor BamB